MQASPAVHYVNGSSACMSFTEMTRPGPVAIVAIAPAVSFAFGPGHRVQNGPLITPAQIANTKIATAPMATMTGRPSAINAVPISVSLLIDGRSMRLLGSLLSDTARYLLSTQNAKLKRGDPV